MTTREALYASTSNQRLDKKGFVFKSYKSEKERIKEIKKNKMLLEQYLDKYIKKKKKQEFSKKLRDLYYYQPSMHFKERIGIEKINDIFKKKHLLNREQKKLYNELLNLGLIHNNYIEYDSKADDYYNIQKDFSMGNFYSPNNILEYNNDRNNFLTDEDKFKKVLHDKILTERKNMLIKRKLLLNLGNKIKSIDNPNTNKLNNEEYQKMHVKAIENLKLVKSSSTMDHKLFKAWSMEDISHQKNINNTKKFFYKTISENFKKLEKNKKIFFPKKSKKNININDIENNSDKMRLKLNKKNTQTELINYNNLKYNKTKNGFNLIDNEKILKDLQITKEIMSVNPLLFKINFNNYKNDKTIKNVNVEEDNQLPLENLDSLKKIAFKNNEEVSSVSSSGESESSYENFRNDDNVVIDGKHFKKNEADKIAENILRKCNWNKKKLIIRMKLEKEN